MPGPNRIDTIVTVTGDADVQAKLKAIGDAGATAAAQLQKAGDTASGGFAKISNVVDTVRGGFANFATALQPLKHSLSEFSELFDPLRERLAEVGEHLGLVFGVGISAAVVGIGELVLKTAEAIHQEGLMAETFGVSLKTLQSFGDAAAIVGADTDKVSVALARLSRAAETQGEAQKAAIVGLAQLLASQNNLSNGVAVLGSNAQTTKSKLIDLGTSFSQVNKVSEQLAPHVAEALKQAGFFADQSNKQVAASLAQIANQTDAAGQKAREFFRVFSDAATAKTLVEALGGEVAKGTDALRKLGIDFLDAHNDVKELDAVLPDIARKLSAIQSPTERTALALQLFGRGGAAMIPILKEFADGSSEAEAKLNLLRNHVTEAQDELNKKFVGAVNLATRALGGLRNQIVLAIEPKLTPLIEAFTEAIFHNATAIIQLARDFGDRLEPAIEAVVRIMKGIPPALDELGKPKTEIDEFQVSFQDIASAIAGVVAGVITFGKVVVETMKVVTAAINDVLEPINDVFGTHLTASSVIAFAAISKLTGAVGILTAAFGVLRSAAGLLLKAFEAIASSGFAKFLGVTSTALGLVTALVALLIYDFEHWAELMKGLSDLWGGFTILVSAFFGLISKKVSEGVQAISDGFKTAGQFIVDTFNAVVTTVADFFSRLADSILDFFRPVLNLLNTAIEKAKQFFGLAGGADISGSADAPVPGLAGGGHIPGFGGGDTVPARLERGEFVINKFSARSIGLGALNAMNRLGSSFTSAIRGFSAGGPVRAFAAGGAVAAAAGGAVHIHIGGKSYGPFRGDGDMVAQLGRAAAKEDMRSMGRAPSWVGSR